MLTSPCSGVRRGCSRNPDAAAAVAELHAALDQPGLSLVVFFCSPRYDLQALGGAMQERFGTVKIIGCTTAGEITPFGFARGALSGFSLGGEDFTCVSERIDRLQDFEIGRGHASAENLLTRLRCAGTTANGADTFAFLLVDGMCMKEEAVVSSIYRSLGDIPLFGGSAGDELRFGDTFVYSDGAFRTDAALLTLIRTSRPFAVVRTQNYVGTDRKMVVTSADPASRVVFEINGAKAGPEYARMVGLHVDRLTSQVFATLPVIVRIGGREYVRGIKTVNEDGSISFHCAIDEGIVLTVARSVDFVANFQRMFDDIRERIGAPELVVGCDCLSRTIDADANGYRDDVDRILSTNNVIGFGTYGEQFNALHVNQTFTGVAIGSAQGRQA